MRLEIENQIFFFNLVNKGHKVDIFNKEISSIDFFCSRTERVKGPKHPHKVKFQKFSFENHDPLRIFSDICVTLN